MSFEAMPGGAIVGMEWHKKVTGDLAHDGAGRYPQLTIANNRVSYPARPLPRHAGLVPASTSSFEASKAWMAGQTAGPPDRTVARP